MIKLSIRLSMILLLAFVGAGCEAGCGDGMPWDADCTIGECDGVRADADDMARDADFDISENTDLGKLNEGEDVIVTGELLDRHVELTFEAETGQWFDITVLSRGLPLPSFVVERSFYQRWTKPHRGGLAQRSVVPPDDGEYKIRIYSDQWEDDEEESPAPEEYEQWRFVLQLEHRPAPEPTILEPGESYTFEGLDLRDNFYQINVSDDAVYGNVSPYKWSGLARRAWQDGEDLSGESYHEPSLRVLADQHTRPGGPIFVADFVHAETYGEHSMDVRISETRGVAVNETVQEVHTIDAGEALAGHMLPNEDGEYKNSFQIKILSQGEPVATYEGGRAVDSVEFPGAYYVSDDGGEYIVEFKNIWRYPMAEIEWTSGVGELIEIGDASASDQLQYSRSEPIGAGDHHVLAFDVTEPVIIEMEFDQWPAPALRLFDGVYPDGKALLYSGFEESSEPIVLEAGTHYALVHGKNESDTIDDGYDLSMSFTEPPEPFEHTETIVLDKGEVVEVSRPINLDSATEAVDVTVERDGVYVFGPAPLTEHEDVRFVAPQDGGYDVVIEGPIWPEVIDFEPEFDFLASQELGVLSVGDPPLELTLEDEDSPYQTLWFETDEPLYMTWTTSDPDDDGGLPDVEMLSLEDGLPVVFEGEGQVGGIVGAGSYFIENEANSNLRFDLRQGVLVAHSIPERHPSPNSDPIVFVDEQPQTSTIDVSGCTQPERVGVDVDFDLSDGTRLILDVESPSGEVVRLLDAGSSDPEPSGIFPDQLRSEESMEALADNSADGTWTLSFRNDSALGSGGELIEWALELWCE